MKTQVIILCILGVVCMMGGCKPHSKQFIESQNKHVEDKGIIDENHPLNFDDLDKINYPTISGPGYRVIEGLVRRNDAKLNLMMDIINELRAEVQELKEERYTGI